MTIKFPYLLEMGLLRKLRKLISLNSKKYRRVSIEENDLADLLEKAGLL